MTRLLITGANGHLGLKLIRQLNQDKPDLRIIALVRSDRAAETIRRENLQVDIHVNDYHDAAGIAVAGQGCDAVVHLVGIIKESMTNTFSMAHEETCRALVEAGLSASAIVCLGIVGSDLGSGNECLSSRARAEKILQAGAIPTTVIRVPMVLGPGDYASMSLSRHARARIVFSFRCGSLEQPIHSEDVISALVAALDLTPQNRILELAGPEVIPRRELIKRAGRVVDSTPLVISLPLSLGYLLAWLLKNFSRNPPLTAAMLGVLDHDDQVDTAAATSLLGLRLTSLDNMLRRVLKPLS